MPSFQESATTALSFDDQQISYAELHIRSCEFAAHLAQLGLGPACTVVLCIERSFDWIVAALGIMRVGAAYVPLDAGWPEFRLKFAIEDSGARILVGRAALLDCLGLPIPGVDPFRDRAAIARAAMQSGPVRPTEIDAESLVYVIYTSGTTGIPKGVEITHGNLCHLIDWHQKAFGITPDDRVSHVAGLGFDASAWEVWPNLSAGATVCLADEASRSSADRSRQWLVRERVTVGFVPTVHAAAMMTMAWPASTALRYLLTGGDTLQQGPQVSLPFEVINNYGPTECTVVATSSRVRPFAQGPPPIGRPIAGAMIYLLDERGNPVDERGTDEIWIGGRGVGRGYRNLPALTARNFAPDPFAPGTERSGTKQCSNRMYRTGDLGTRRPDGEIEFRGRLDRQVKLRGHRVELDEIGHTLSRAPDVKFAVAIAVPSGTGEMELLAYVLPRPQACDPTVQELQHYLLTRLPGYMLPKIFFRLTSLPVSRNGKLDLSLLPQPNHAVPLDSEFMPKLATRYPSHIQKQLLAMVREMVQDGAVGAKDNFFLAGGHSLLAMQLIVQIRAVFGEELSLQQLFETPTVELLGSWIEARQAGRRVALIGDGLPEDRPDEPQMTFFASGDGEELPPVPGERIGSEPGNGLSGPAVSEHRTVARQAQHIGQLDCAATLLPSGVLALNTEGTRENIFWIHIANLDLARELGADQPFFLVTMTPMEFHLLGVAPSLQKIAALFLGKIVATQSSGPYIIGGVCAGSILAFEIASQMQAAGHHVSNLLLLDAPTQPYIGSCHRLRFKLSHPGYLVSGVSRTGFRKSLRNLNNRLQPRVPPSTLLPGGEKSAAHRIIEGAVFAYHPKIFEGKVLLLLARERAPFLNFLHGWRSIVPDDLSFHTVKGRHRRIITPQNVADIARIISDHLGIGLRTAPDVTRTV